MKTFIGPIESPVKIINNGKTIAGFLCTPENLLEMAVGHLLTRGLIFSPAEITSVVEDRENGIVEIVTENPLKKPIYSVPEFVISGNSTVGHFSENINRLSAIQSGLTVSLAELFDAANILGSAPLYKKTGGVHGAVIRQGERSYLREDIGRHCAVDKAVGAAVNDGANFSQSYICTTGRISLDMILKAAAVGIPIIASLKSVSSLAFELAQKYNITVIGQLKGSNPLVFSGEHRVLK